jgi:hypothetical protein
MKYVKMLGLAAVAAMALMAFASSASATTLTCTNPPGTKVTCPAGTVIDASAESSLTLHAGFANITCTESTVKGQITKPGSSTETASGPIETLTFANCPNAKVVVIKKGTLEVHTDEEGVTNGNGTVTSSGAEVTVETAGITCTYATNNTDIGTLTGSSVTGSTATFDINAELTRVAGNIFFCATPAHWEGNYKITEPDWLDVD